MTGEFEALADVATGGLAAHAVDGAGNRQGKGEGACPNCGTMLVGPHCHQCGQAGHVHRTAGALFHDIAHGVFHLEGRTWHTLPLLFWKPGELTRRYVHGERVKFVSPMALFLFSVFLVVATFSLVGNLTGGNHESALTAARVGAGVDLSKANAKLADLEAARKSLRTKGVSTRAIDEQITETSSEIAGLRMITTGQVKPDTNEIKIGSKAIHSGIPALDSIITRATRNPELTIYKLQTAAYKFSWALIPISLPFIWLMFAFRRDVGLYDHAIFATYSLSAMSIMVILLWIAAGIGVWPTPLWIVAMIFPPWHMYRQLKGAYLLGRFGALWRTVFLVIAAYTAALIFFTTILVMELNG